MTSRNQPDAGVTRYKYDSRHNVRFSQNAQQAADGKVSYFTYDPFSRMIRSGEVTQVFASLDANAAYAFETDAASWTNRYIYDAGESGARATFPVGRPTRIKQNTDADAAAEVQARIAYDHEGRVTHRRVSVDTLPDKEIFYSYDLSGKVTAMVYPDGSEVHYAYDEAGTPGRRDRRRRKCPGRLRLRRRRTHDHPRGGRRAGHRRLRLQRARLGERDKLPRQVHHEPGI